MGTAPTGGRGSGGGRVFLTAQRCGLQLDNPLPCSVLIPAHACAVFLHRLPKLLLMAGADPGCIDCGLLPHCGIALGTLVAPGLFLWAAHTATIASSSGGGGLKGLMSNGSAALGISLLGSMDRADPADPKYGIVELAPAPSLTFLHLV